MPDDQRQITLLGPQPNFETLKVALTKLGTKLPVALITAGWETDEHEDDAVKKAANSVGVECVNLNLFARTEQLFADDPELIQTLQTRQDELRHLRDLYNDRLHHQLKSARRVIRKKEELIEFKAERASAIEMVRQLDCQYFVRTSQIIDRCEKKLNTAERPFVAEHRREIQETLDRSGAILISGGHVAIILNRLKIFGILETKTDLPIIAWSGGTMALADQIVFFHDSPPQGAGNPEVLRSGMGMFHDILPLPDAATRLNLDDRARVELFSRRFDQYQCVVFDEHTILERVQGVWAAKGSKPTLQLGSSGDVIGMKA